MTSSQIFSPPALLLVNRYHIAFGHLTDIHIYVLSIYYLRDSVIWYGGYLGILILPRLYWFLELFQTMRYCININIMSDI